MGHTLEAVSDVATLYQNQQDARFWIKELGDLTRQVKKYLASGQVQALGQVMNQAHLLLQKLGVSDEKLDYLVDVAQVQGALGAKLTGGGRGGCMIALAANQHQAEKIAQALERAGACQTWIQYLGE